MDENARTLYDATLAHSPDEPLPDGAREVGWTTSGWQPDCAACVAGRCLQRLLEVDGGALIFVHGVALQ